MNKITQVVTEPPIVRVGSPFKLKIKATRYLTYDELKRLTYDEIKQITNNRVKGE